MKLNNLFLKQLLLFLLIFSEGYGITVSSSIQSSSTFNQIGNRANQTNYNVIPTYIYRNIREDINGVQLYSNQRLWSIVNNYPSGGTPSTDYIEYRMYDDKGGSYELLNPRYTGTGASRTTRTSETTWEVNSTTGGDATTEGYFDVKYTLPNTDSLDDQLINVSSYMRTEILPKPGGNNNVGTSTRTATYRLATYTTLNVNDLDFGTIVPNSNKNYEKTSTIAIGGGKNTTVNIGINAGSGTVFGQKTVGKLVRAGSSEYIPVEFSIVDGSGNITSTARINDNWGGEAYLKGFIPSYALTPKLPRGRYNGTVTVEITTQ